jgi:hypothetical protein
MPRKGTWMTMAHVDFLNELLTQDERSTLQISTIMSRHFGHRITPAHVTALLGRMRKPGDVFFRNTPYRRRAANRY